MSIFPFKMITHLTSDEKTKSVEQYWTIAEIVFGGRVVE